MSREGIEIYLGCPRERIKINLGCPRERRIYFGFPKEGMKIISWISQIWDINILNFQDRGCKYLGFLRGDVNILDFPEGV